MGRVMFLDKELFHASVNNFQDYFHDSGSMCPRLVTASSDKSLNLVLTHNVILVLVFLTLIWIIHKSLTHTMILIFPSGGNPLRKSIYQ